MPDYGEILSFLAANPPQFEDERELHASLLELLAKCLRDPELARDVEVENLPAGHFRWTNVN